VSFIVVEFMVDNIAFGTDGIVDVALQEAKAKSCFTLNTNNGGAAAAIHLM
jgi:hypothetical protein